MLTVRIAVAAAVWLIPGAALAAGCRTRVARPLYPAGLAVAAAVTAGVLADELRQRGGDDAYESCARALADQRRAERRQHRPEARRGVTGVVRLA
jgi:ribose 1,5-bisphosphokinase PhnN